MKIWLKCRKVLFCQLKKGLVSLVLKKATCYGVSPQKFNEDSVFQDFLERARERVIQLLRTELSANINCCKILDAPFTLIDEHLLVLVCSIKKFQ